jgi:uncharacterized protein YkwD
LLPYLTGLTSFVSSIWHWLFLMRRKWTDFGCGFVDVEVTEIGRFAERCASVPLFA